MVVGVVLGVMVVVDFKTNEFTDKLTSNRNKNRPCFPQIAKLSPKFRLTMTAPAKKATAWEGRKERRDV